MKKAVIILAVALVISLAGNVYQLVNTVKIADELAMQRERTAELEAEIGKLTEEIETLKLTNKSALEDAQNKIKLEQQKSADLEAQVIVLTAELERQKSLNTKLSELTAEQLVYFKSTSEMYVQDVLDGKMTLEACEAEQNGLIETIITANTLPLNAVKLFGEWKLENNWYIQFLPPEPEPEPEPKKETKKESKKDKESKESSSSSKSWDEMTQEERDKILAEAYESLGDTGGQVDDRWLQGGDELPDWLLSGKY